MTKTCPEHAENRCRTINLIQSELEWDGLLPEWNELVDRGSSASVFSTWEWLRPWWRHYHKPTDSLFILVVREGDRLVGLAPLYRRIIRPFGVRPLVRLGFIGDSSGDSEYLDFICDDVCASGVLSCILGFLFSDDASWDLLALHLMREWSPSVAELRGLVAEGHRPHREDFFSCSAVLLPSDWDDYLRGVGRRRFRTKIRALLRRYSREKPLRLVRCSDKAELPGRLRSLFRLHGKRWRAQGKPGAFALASRRRFYEEMSAGFGAQDRLRFYSLERDGVPLAHEINLEYSNRVYCLQQGYDPTYHQWAVGNMLKALVLRDCIHRNIDSYDLLGGDDSYKKNWEAASSRCVNITVARSKIVALLYLSLPRQAVLWRGRAKAHLPEVLLSTIRGIRQMVDRSKKAWFHLRGYADLDDM